MYKFLHFIEADWSLALIIRLQITLQRSAKLRKKRNRIQINE